MKNINKTANTAMLAGEILLISGTEIFRIEDTMDRILDTAPSAKHNVMVMSTGISLTLSNSEGVVTMTNRVRDRSTNLNRIYLVNNISRQLQSGRINIEQAYKELNEIKKLILYPPLIKYSFYVLSSLLFTILFSGNLIECAGAFFAGIALALVHFGASKLGFNDFIVNALATFFLTLTAIILKRFVFISMNIDPVIISGLTPLVPGVAFSNSMRDIFNGDYISGTGRMLEAVVTALGLAVGVGTAVAITGSWI
mgnify:FL=1